MIMVRREGSISDKRIMCREFLKDWMETNCQKMPDRAEAATGRPTWLWPASYTRRSIHQEYVGRMLSTCHTSYEYDAFIKILANDPEFSNCRRADSNSNFKCNICLSIAQNLEFYRRNNVAGCHDDVILELEAENTAHMDVVNSQRAVYKRNQQIARDQPDMYLSIIADGMDQTKLSCPSLSSRKHLSELHSTFM